ncbi:MAG: lysophospholipid acyltransferase family protein [Sphingobacteriales bacterium]
MVRNKKNFIIRWVLHTYVMRTIKRHLHELIFNQVETDPSKSILLLANHFSYWDSLILYIVNRKLFKRKYHVMVREDTTVKLQYLKYGGAFSVNKKSRDMLQSLDYAAQLLQSPQNMVLIFPQGKLYSNFVNDVHFEKGITKIMAKAEGKFQLIFVATFIQYMRSKKPNVTIYLENAASADKTLDELKTAYQQFFDRVKKEQTEIVI